MDNERPNPDDHIRMEEILKKLDAEEAAQPQGAPEATEQEQVSAQPSEEAAPEETPASGEETGHSEPAPPAIEPPKFLKAEYRDKWKDLPTDWQQYLRSQEEENSRVVSERLSEAAEQRRKAEQAEKQALERAQAVQQEQQRYVQGLAQLAQHWETADPVIAGYNKLLREDKLVALAREKPAEYAELDAAYRARMNALQQVNAERQNVQNRLLAEHFAREEQALREKLPEWADTTVGKKAIDDLRSFAQKTYAFKPEEVQTIADHRYVLMARDAARYHELKAEVDAIEKKAAEEAAQAKAALAAKKVAPKPQRVVVPTASGDVVGKTQAERDKALIAKARGVKSISDKAEILSRL